MNELVGGWEISGINNLESGSLATFGCASGLPGQSPCFHFNLNPGVPIYSAAKAAGNFDPLNSFYFNPAAFSDPNSNTRISAGGGYQYGNLPTNVDFIRFPTSPNSSFSLIKHFAVAQEANVELRGELFNAFNQHGLGGANTNPNGSNFGQISSASAARTGQLINLVCFKIYGFSGRGSR